MAPAPRKKGSLGRALVLSAAGGAAVYVAIAAFVGWGKVSAELARYRWSTAGVALALAMGNYLLRFLKWELYLRRLEVRLPAWESLTVFFAGFSLTVTPGKVGEVLKAYLIREKRGIPMARTAPIVVAERVTDLIALIALCTSGVGAMMGVGGTRLILAAAGLVVLFLVFASSRPLAHFAIRLVGKVPIGARLAPKLLEFYDAMALLLRPVPLTLATLLSIAAWFLECVAFWVILAGFGAEASLLLCTFIYAAMTIAGALSFLPGGLLVQESGMVGLLVTMARGVAQPVAAAATFVTRLCTLWFAVLLGVIALVVARRDTEVSLGALGEARAAEKA